MNGEKDPMATSTLIRHVGNSKERAAKKVARKVRNKRARKSRRVNRK